MKLKNRQDGFTIIELLIFILIIAVVGLVGVTNVRIWRAEKRDRAAKIDINATAFQLESFYEKNGFYPNALSDNALKGISPDNLKDASSKKANEPSSAYIYKPQDCVETKCKSFILSADLEREALYVKESLNS